MTTARWRTLSSRVGIPSGRVSVAEPPFGMCTLRTGGAWYVPDFTRSSRRCRLPSKSCSYSSAVTPSTPTAPSLRVRFLQPVEVHQVGQRSERPLRGLFRQLGYPLLFRGHGGRISMHSPCFSRGFRDPTPRFPPLAPAGDRSPASPVLSRRYDLLLPIPPHFVAFVWWYLSVHSFFS